MKKPVKAWAIVGKNDKIRDIYLTKGSLDYMWKNHAYTRLLLSAECRIEEVEIKFIRELKKK